MESDLFLDTSYLEEDCQLFGDQLFDIEPRYFSSVDNDDKGSTFSDGISPRNCFGNGVNGISPRNDVNRHYFPSQDRNLTHYKRNQYEMTQMGMDTLDSNKKRQRLEIVPPDLPPPAYYECDDISEMAGVPNLLQRPESDSSSFLFQNEAPLSPGSSETVIFPLLSRANALSSSSDNSFTVPDNHSMTESIVPPVKIELNSAGSNSVGVASKGLRKKRPKRTEESNQHNAASFEYSKGEYKLNATVKGCVNEQEQHKKVVQGKQRKLSSPTPRKAVTPVVAAAPLSSGDHVAQLYKNLSKYIPQFERAIIKPESKPSSGAITDLVGSTGIGGKILLPPIDLSVIEAATSSFPSMNNYGNIDRKTSPRVGASNNSGDSLGLEKAVHFQGLKSDLVVYWPTKRDGEAKVKKKTRRLSGDDTDAVLQSESSSSSRTRSSSSNCNNGSECDDRDVDVTLSESKSAAMSTNASGSVADPMVQDESCNVTSTSPTSLTDAHSSGNSASRQPCSASATADSSGSRKGIKEKKINDVAKVIISVMESYLEPAFTDADSAATDSAERPISEALDSTNNKVAACQINLEARKDLLLSKSGCSTATSSTPSSFSSSSPRDRDDRENPRSNNQTSSSVLFRIDHVAQSLGVNVRMVYDVINVFKVLGLVSYEKVSGGMLKWVGKHKMGERLAHMQNAAVARGCTPSVSELAMQPRIDGVGTGAPGAGSISGAQPPSKLSVFPDADSQPLRLPSLLPWEPRSTHSRISIPLLQPPPPPAAESSASLIGPRGTCGDEEDIASLSGVIGIMSLAIQMIEVFLLGYDQLSIPAAVDLMASLKPLRTESPVTAAESPHTSEGCSTSYCSEKEKKSVNNAESKSFSEEASTESPSCADAVSDSSHKTSSKNNKNSNNNNNKNYNNSSGISARNTRNPRYVSGVADIFCALGLLQGFNLRQKNAHFKWIGPNVVELRERFCAGDFSAG